MMPGDADIRNAPVLRETQSRDPLVGEQHGHGADGTIPEAEVGSGEVGCDALGLSDLICNVLCLAEVATADQKRHVRMCLSQGPGGMLPNDARAADKKYWVG